MHSFMLVFRGLISAISIGSRVCVCAGTVDLMQSFGSAAIPCALLCFGCFYTK